MKRRKSARMNFAKKVKADPFLALRTWASAEETIACLAAYITKEEPDEAHDQIAEAIWEFAKPDGQCATRGCIWQNVHLHEEAERKGMAYYEIKGDTWEKGYVRKFNCGGHAR